MTTDLAAPGLECHLSVRNSAPAMSPISTSNISIVSATWLSSAGKYWTFYTPSSIWNENNLSMTQLLFVSWPRKQLTFCSWEFLDILCFSCLLEGYEVLPSSPVNFRFSNLETSYGILHWDPPEVRGDTVLHYVVTYEQLTPKHTEAKTVDNAKSPFILENLGKVRI